MGRVVRPAGGLPPKHLRVGRSCLVTPNPWLDQALGNAPSAVACVSPIPSRRAAHTPWCQPSETRAAWVASVVAVARRSVLGLRHRARQQATEAFGLMRRPKLFGNTGLQVKQRPRARSLYSPQVPQLQAIRESVLQSRDILFMMNPPDDTQVRRRGAGVSSCCLSPGARSKKCGPEAGHRSETSRGSVF